MTHQELTDLTTRLAALHSERRQDKQRQDQRQALDTGPKPQAPPTGRPRLFGFPDPALATTLHLRLELPMRSLAIMFNTSSATIHRAITEIRQPLDQQGTLIAPAPAPAAPIRTTASPSSTTAQIKTAS